MNRGALPTDWREVALDEVVRTSSGGTPSSKNPAFYGGNIPWVKIGDLTDGPIGATEQTITGAGLDASTARWLPADTVLVAMYGSIGKLGILEMAATTNQAICAMQPGDMLDRDYLFWFLMASREHLTSLGRGGTQRNIGQKDLRALRLPLPPLREQRAIVQAVEQIFGEVDNGLVSFERAQAGTDAYIRGLYAEAFSGGLTGGPTGTASDSLLEDLGVSAADRPADGTHWPSHWSTARLGDLASHLTSGSRDWKPYYERGTGVFVLTQNVRMRRLDVSQPFHVDPPRDDPARVRSVIAKDDLLVTIVGANVGNTARVPTELTDHYVCQSLALIRPREAAMSRFLELYLSAPDGGQRYFASCFYGQGRPHISFADLKRMPVPIPPRPEQELIVTAFDQQVAALQGLRMSLSTAQNEAQRLRRSVLYQAFRGQLGAGSLASNRHAELAGAHA